MNQINGTMGRWQGAGLMATTLLGTGIFILPQMTILIANTSALVAWLALVLVMIPITLVFARLSSAFPHAAGPAHFIGRAFGAIAGRAIGLMFLLVVPLGLTAAILMSFQFLHSLVPLTPGAEIIAQLLLLPVLLLLNARGMQVSAKLQLLLTLGIVAVVLLLFIPTMGNELPAGSNKILDTFEIETTMAAMGIAFWSFLGLEAMSHLANDFRNPKKDLLPAMLIGTLLVGLVYLACTWVLIMTPNQESLTIIGAFDVIVKESFGGLLAGKGTQIIAILGLFSGLATVNVYANSSARLLWSLSSEGIMPNYFNRLSCHQTPVRAQGGVLCAIAGVLIIIFITKQSLEDMIAWTNGVFVLIYLASMLAAFKLLSKTYLTWVILGSLFCLILALTLAENMLYALVLLLFVSALLIIQQKHLGLRRVKAMAHPT